jgi:hypothetical protein
MYNGYQTLVMHNPFSRYSETHIIHNCGLFIMSVTDTCSEITLALRRLEELFFCCLYENRYYAMTLEGIMVTKTVLRV